MCHQPKNICAGKVCQLHVQDSGCVTCDRKLLENRNYSLHGNDTGSARTRVHKQQHALHRCCCCNKSTPTVVFLHGLLGSSNTFTHLFPLLSGKFRCIAVDLLGFGRSEWPGPESGIHYTIDDHVDALHKVLDAVLPVCANVILVGYSMGAVIAANYITKHATTSSSGQAFQRDYRLVLLSPAYFGTNLDGIEHHLQHSNNTGSIMWRNPMLTKCMCKIVCSNRWFWSPLLTRLVCMLAPYLQPEVVDDYMRHSHFSAIETLRNCCVELPFHHTLHQLYRRKLPLYVIAGDKDRVAPYKYIDMHLHEAHPEAVVETVSGGGHLWLFQRPGQLLNVIDLVHRREFLGERYGSTDADVTK